MKKLNLLVFLFALIYGQPLFAQFNDNIVDEIVWVVGDEAIWRSDVENERRFMLSQGQRFYGDPYCVIPEQLAIRKLFLSQARIDSITVNEAQIIQSVDQRINEMILQIGGSREKLEEYFGKKISQIKQEQKEMMRDNEIVELMKQKIEGKINMTPSEIRRYVNQIPQDSLPFIQQTVEVQLVTIEPKIPLSETDAIKARLREFTDQIHKGEMEFSTLARLYSQDPGSALRGGELGFLPKSNLEPEFANVAFNLTDPKRVSKIVETEFGYHIIQLIEKRGDRINCRHILLKPRVSPEELKIAEERMDSICTDLKNEKFTFEDAAMYISYDKDTRSNKGLMVNQNQRSSHYGTPKFEMSELPQEIGKVVYDMNPGDISKPFTMISEKTNKEVVAIVKLKNRTAGHRANMLDDFQALKTLVENKKKAELIEEWILKKQKETYVRIDKNWRNCTFKYPGWIKE